jgi:hypothetical protein
MMCCAWPGVAMGHVSRALALIYFLDKAPPNTTLFPPSTKTHCCKAHLLSLKEVLKGLSAHSRRISELHERKHEIIEHDCLDRNCRRFGVTKYLSLQHHCKCHQCSMGACYQCLGFTYCERPTPRTSPRTIDQWLTPQHASWHHDRERPIISSRHI